MSNAISWSCIPVLQFLWGQELDDVAKAFLHSLRPSSIRYSEDGCIKCDARPWRVTVYLNGRGSSIITKIEQEVEVLSTDAYPTGYDLSNALYQRGIDIHD